MEEERKRMVRYGEGFKREVVALYEKGGSASGLSRLYGIGGSMTIQKWAWKYGRRARVGIEHIRSITDVDKMKQLEREKAELQRQLGKAHMKLQFYEELVEVAEEHYQIDIKKTLGSGDNAFGGSGSKSKDSV